LIDFPRLIVREACVDDPDAVNIPDASAPAPDVGLSFVQRFNRLRAECKAKRTRASPSTQAQPSAFRSIQKSAGRYGCLRPPSAEPGLPLTLLHPVFAEFVDDAKTIVPKHMDYETASNIRDTMCQFFQDKQIRPIIGEYLSDYFGMKVSSGHVRASEASTDGHISVGKHPIFILELKREVGSTSSEPSLQALAYFGHFCDQYKLWDDVTSCHPCFIAHIAGQFSNYLADSSFALNQI
jgi:hypothetical protein